MAADWQQTTISVTSHLTTNLFLFLLQLNLFDSCNPQTLEHLHSLPVPCRHIRLSSTNLFLGRNHNIPPTSTRTEPELNQTSIKPNLKSTTILSSKNTTATMARPSTETVPQVSTTKKTSKSNEQRESYIAGEPDSAPELVRFMKCKNDIDINDISMEDLLTAATQANQTVSGWEVTIMSQDERINDCHGTHGTHD